MFHLSHYKSLKTPIKDYQEDSMSQFSLFKPTQEEPEELVIELRPGQLFRISPQKIEEGRVPIEIDSKKKKYIKEYQDRSKTLFYMAKSAFHKEIRRGNTGRALGFGIIMDRYKDGETRRYLRKILFEETRSLDLLSRFSGNDDLRDLIHLACCAVKDWELPQDHGWFSPRWLATQVELGGTEYQVRYPWPSDIQTHVLNVLKREDFEELHRMTVAIGLAGGQNKVTRNAWKEMRDILIDHAAQKRPDLAKPLKMCRSPQNDEMSAVVAIIDGSWDDAANMYHPGKQYKKIDLPKIESYVFDCHTWIGKKWMEEAGGTIAWNMPQPGRIDLRWSGAEAGTLWRYLAIAQHGRVEVKWEDVEMSSEMLATWKIGVGKVT